MNKFKKICHKYSHIVPFLIFFSFYLPWFILLEKKITTYRIIHTTADDVIPFCEFFIIPYFFWFVYVFISVAFAFFTDKAEYTRTSLFLMTGMTLFLIISTIWPNGHNLRPLILPRDNAFTHLVDKLYMIDTPTNLWPSIHVYNSIAAHLCITHCKFTKTKKYITIPSLIISIAIILSTMFLKQHSLFDVATALFLCTLMYIVLYKTDFMERAARAIHKTPRQKFRVRYTK